MSDVTAKFTVNPQKPIETEFSINVSNMDHNVLYNRDLPNQHPMSAITGLESALDDKVEKTDTASKVYGTDSEGNQTLYDAGSFGQVDDVRVNGVSVVENKIANLGTMALENASDYSTKAVADTLYASISYEATIDNHIVNKNNPHEVNKAQVGLGNVDNTSDLNKPISTATQTALNGKQNTISDLATIRSDASSGASAYATIQNYGDIVTHNSSEFATSAQGALADSAVQPSDLATVATTGSYNDLINKPTIPAAQVNSDWNATSGVAEILNKPTIPMVPTNVSAFTNDAGYITSAALTGYATENYVDTGLSGKQATLVSGTNIKTINNQSILGSGNIDIQGGGAVNSVNGQTGAVVLTASDVGALPDSTVIPTEATVSGWGFTKNVGTVTSVNNVAPVNGNVSLSIPTVYNSTITFTQGGVSKGSFTLNQSTGATIALDAGGGGSDVEAFTAAEVQTIWDNN